MSPPRSFRTASGKQVLVGNELGRGGEGIVYELAGAQHTAAKIYHPSHAGSREQKICAMVAANWHATTKQVTFPIEPLFDPSGKFVGFTMRRVGQQTPIHNLSSPTSRKTLFPQANFPFLLRTALNISRAVA